MVGVTNLDVETLKAQSAAAQFGLGVWSIRLVIVGTHI